MAKKPVTENALPKDQAKLVLENVFNACSVPPNSVPMEILEDNIRHNRFLTIFTRFLAVAALLAMILVPLFLSKASVSCSLGVPQEHSVEVTIDAASLLPVSRVSFTLDGTPLDYYRENGNYIVTVTSNGTLVAEVTTLNNQTTQVETTIIAFSAEKPRISTHTLDHGLFTFTVVQGTYPVDFAGIYAMDESGARVSPASCDESTGVVSFDHVEGVYNFFVPDVKGNVLQAILTPASVN